MLINENADDYRQDPCVVEIFGGRVVCSRPCIGDLKTWNPIHLPFDSEGFVGLRAALCSFLGGHERLFLCYACSVACACYCVVSLLSLKVSNFLGCMLYCASGYLFKILARSLYKVFSSILLVSRHGFVEFKLVCNCLHSRVSIGVWILLYVFRLSRWHLLHYSTSLLTCR